MRWKQIFLIFAALLFIVFAISNCTPTEMLRSSGGPSCERPIILESLDYPSANKCSTVSYILPIDKSLPGRRDYSYSFLELDENIPSKTKSEVKGDPQQLQKVLESLSTNEKKFVVVYIHGWRHDARIGDTDERAFRKFLAYSRSFLNQREEYRQTKLVGVYVGWRGALVNEPSNEIAGLAVALPSFWSRENKSIEHAHSILKYLKQIEGTLRLDRGNPRADKMLVYGHSMGANILATSIHDCLTGASGVECGDGPNKLSPLRDHKAGHLMKGPLGDLTVLVNAASRSQNWTDLQMVMREMRGQPWLKGQTVENGISFRNPLFPERQPPTYISLTSTANFHESECAEAGCLKKYDTATQWVYSLAHLNTETALGHVFPTKTFPFGASHEIITNNAAQAETSFSGALSYKTSVCLRATNAILNARKIAASEGGAWDTDPGNSPRTLSVSRKPDKIISIQIRQLLAPASNPGKNSIYVNSFEEPNTPFWNARVSPNTIEEHGNYKNYPLWCTLNQLVLDDTTGVQQSLTDH